MEHVLILGLRSQFCERLALIAQQGACFLLGKNRYLCNSKDIEMKKQISYLLKAWAWLSLVALVLYWVLWWIVAPSSFDPEWMSWRQFGFDVGYCVVLTFIFVVIDFCFRLIFHRAMHTHIGFMSMSLCMLVTNVATALLIENWVERWIYDDFTDKFVWTQGTLILGLIAAFLTMLAIIEHHYRLMEHELERNQRMEVQMLKRQLDPHFLFNNLSTVASTLDPDTPAYEMLQQLARVYRHVVTGLTLDTQKLCECKQVIQAYVYLINLRAPGHFNIMVDPAVYECEKLVLPLSLQVLLENAMKHNKHSKAQPIAVNIAIKDGCLVVTNTLRQNDVWQHSSHQGLDNLRRRYRYVAQRDIVVEKRQDEFEVRLPLIDHLPKTKIK